MKHKQPEDALYADLLDQRQSDETLSRLVHDLGTLHSVSLPPTLSWTAIEEKHLEQRFPQRKVRYMEHYSVQEKQNSLARVTRTTPFRFSRRFGIVAAIILAMLVLSGLAMAYVAISPLVRDLFKAYPPTHGVLQKNEFIQLHQSQTAGGLTVNLEAAYADSNQVIIGYTISPAHEDLNVAFTLTTKQGLTLPEHLGGQVNYDAPISAAMESFDAGVITGSPQQLDLHLKGTVIKNAMIRKPETLGSMSFDFSVPFHIGKILTPHQSVTTNGQTITLERVVVTPTETRIIVSGLKNMSHNLLKDYVLGIAAPVYVSHTSKQYDYGSASPASDNQQVYTSWIFVYPHDLYNNSGTWKLQITQTEISRHLQQNSTPTQRAQGMRVTNWTFQLVVP